MKSYIFLESLSTVKLNGSKIIHYLTLLCRLLLLPEGSAEITDKRMSLTVLRMPHLTPASLNYKYLINKRDHDCVLILSVRNQSKIRAE